MAKQNALVARFNLGIVDPMAYGRAADLKRVALAAETMTNWMPRELGPMSLRTGLEYIGSTRNNDEAKHIPFVFSIFDTAIVEVTDSAVRVRVDEAVITRSSVSSTITNGTFDTNLSGWTDADETGAASTWATGGYLSLVGTLFDAAILRQQVSVIQSDRNVEHGIKLVVQRGPVTLKLGSTSGGSEYIEASELAAGVYSFGIVPSGDIYIELSSRSQAAALVDSIAIEASGDMVLAAPWQVGDLQNLRWDQSADVVYVACNNYLPRKIERRATRSWGLAQYLPEDGPFRSTNGTTITMTPSALTGDITLTASRAYFNSDNVGSLFRLTSIGQKVEVDVTAENQFSDSIKVTGTGTTSRRFSITRAGTWSATVTLQRSVDEEGSWNDVTTYTTNATTDVDDGLDDQIVYYRAGVKTGEFTSGTVELTLAYTGGSKQGIARVTSYTSATVVNAAVLKPMGETPATTIWEEGLWSTRRGFPSSVAFYEGRLWWAGKDKIIGSVSDAFESFDDNVEGDSGPINRSIGSGPVDMINWMLPLQRLIVGTQSAEISVRSSSQDEPLTPTNFNLKIASTQGSLNLPVSRIDSRGIYVQKSGQRIFELTTDPNIFDYVSNDLSLLVPDIGGFGFSAIAVQRQPDTRIHALRQDGTAAVLVYLPAEDVRAWVEIETGDADNVNGVIEDVFVMPADIEDAVYYSIKRVIDGADVRYLEKFALISDCVGGDYNCQSDSFRMFINNPASATVSGLTHLEGEDVVVWADGKCLRDASDEIETFTVSGGSITLTNDGSSYTATRGIVGLPYTAQFKTGKLPYASSGIPLTQFQRISRIGLLLENTHHRGLEFGRDFTNVNNLPQIVDGTSVSEDTVHSALDLPSVTFPGNTDTDIRVCLQAKAPRPATVLAAVIGIATHDTAP